MTGCYDELVDAGVRTRFAATLTGLSKATQDRRRRTPVPVNKLTDTVAAELVAVLNSQRFVDKSARRSTRPCWPMGRICVSISMMYRTLERNRQVK